MGGGFGNKYLLSFRWCSVCQKNYIRTRVLAEADMLASGAFSYVNTFIDTTVPDDCLAFRRTPETKWDRLSSLNICTECLVLYREQHSQENNKHE